MSREIEYRPRIVSPPGDTLQELLDEMNLSQAEFAERTGHSQKTINEIIKGKAPISRETALNFEKVLGTSATFWNTREQHYREYLTSIEEKERLEKSLGWLKEIPYKELQERNYIPSIEDKLLLLNTLLSFFAIANVNQWHTYWKNAGGNFRAASFDKDKIGAIASWLRIGEIEASKITTVPYDQDHFESILKKIRESIIKNFEWQKLVQELCAEAGVAVVFTPQIKGIGIYGCARWLTPKKALIQLSMRGKRDDQFWFTFFHEATHILKHKKKVVYLDDAKTHEDLQTQEENEANENARDILIPLKDWEEFVYTDKYNSSTILLFSKKIKITPGIVVGRLHREGLVPHNRFQELKTEVAEIEGS
jgi:addiction module HigA family antidote